MNPQPFFILGSPRSGTTLLRNLLRSHPSLEAPEETFFYRWSDPFGTGFYTHVYQNNVTIKKHREMDGISDEEFQALYERCTSRRELQIGYMKLFLEKKKRTDAIWFDKTPQNAFGLFRILDDFPDSRIIHIHRNPVNVVSSIRQGRSVGPESLTGSINIWRESVALPLVARRLAPERILFVAYESLSLNPSEILQQITEFLGLDPLPRLPRNVKIHEPEDRYANYLPQQDILVILDRLAKEMSELGYSTQVADYPEGLAEEEPEEALT